MAAWRISKSSFWATPGQSGEKPQITGTITGEQPVKVYAGMPVGQLIYFPVDGEIEIKYNQKANAKYSGQPDRPVESMMWKNKF